MRKSSIIFVLFLCGFFCGKTVFAASVSSKSAKHLPENLLLFKKCYPDIFFEEEWDFQKKDWKLTLFVPKSPKSKEKKSSQFFWADGRLLPESEWEKKEEWWSLFYSYDKTLRDPATFSQEEIERMKKFGSKESQQNTAGSPMFFFDFLYDSWSESEIEKHIVRTTFLGKKTKIHERIKEPLERVEKRILALKEKDKDVKAFLKTLSTADAYFWRTIANTNRKSFHSYGIAIDVLPKRLFGKETYWSWAKDSRGDKWMLTPLSQRWSPPKAVIDIFESEGFIWGGKWAVWDTMHFEYHPELIYWNKIVPLPSE